MQKDDPNSLTLQAMQEELSSPPPLQVSEEDKICQAIQRRMGALTIIRTPKYRGPRLAKDKGPNRPRDPLKTGYIFSDKDMRLLDQFVFDTTRVIPLVGLTVLSALIGGLFYLIFSWLLKINEFNQFTNLAGKMIKKYLPLKGNLPKK